MLRNVIRKMYQKIQGFFQSFYSATSLTEEKNATRFEIVEQRISREYPGQDWAVSTTRMDLKEKIVSDHPELKLEHNSLSCYWRYCSPEAKYVAQTWAQKVGALKHGFHATLTNSGMASIDLALRACDLRTSDVILHGETLYSETPNAIKAYEAFGVSTATVETQAIEDVREAIRDHNPKIFLAETIANGYSMDELDVFSLLNGQWNEDIIIILDNTFLTHALLNIFKIYEEIRMDRGEPTCRLVVIESLTKHYRATEKDDVHAGLICASHEFIAKCDEIMMHTGQILPAPSLRQMPFDLAAAAESVMETLSQNAEAACQCLFGHYTEYIRNISWAKRRVGGGDGGVFFVIMDITEDQFDSLKEALIEIFGEEMASFGHKYMSWILFHAYVPSLEPGYLRFATGWGETKETTISKIELFLEKLEQKLQQ